MYVYRQRPHWESRLNIPSQKCTWYNEAYFIHTHIYIYIYIYILDGAKGLRSALLPLLSGGLIVVTAEYIFP